MRLKMAILGGLLTLSTFAALEPSDADLWELSNGNRIIRTSGTGSAGSEGGIFGQNGHAFVPENTYTLFRDDVSPSFVHFIEWQTPRPVRLDHIRLFAVGDGPIYNNQREFVSFRLLAQSIGSQTFDKEVILFKPTNPYTFVDRASWAMLDTDVNPIIAQSFRAEFIQYPGGRGFDGPRIRELDGFGIIVPEPTTVGLLIFGAVILVGGAVRRTPVDRQGLG